MPLQNPELFTASRRVFYPLAALLIITFAGALGYHFIEGWSLFDGLYMTVITLATIGYGEVRPLTQTGRVFTLGLIVVGVAAVGFLISYVTQALVESQLAAALGRRRMYKDITNLKNHHILCGAGRVGIQIIDEFRKKGADYIVIERDPHVAERLLARGDLVLIGDATEEEVLAGAQAKTARSLIAAASSDAENVYIALTARGLNPDLYIVARASDQSAARQMHRAGVNKVVSPALIGSHRMAQAALSPAVADFIELTTMTETLDLIFEQIRIEPGSPLDGRKIRDSGIRSEHNAIIVAITDREGRMQFNPDGECVLRTGDMLIAIGTTGGLRKLSEIARYERGKTRPLSRG
jgi:voltage-gated potassium channel